LIPVSTWPGFRSVYTFDLDSTNQISLVVTLEFDSSKIGKSQAQGALDRLEQISEQIHDKNLAIAVTTSAVLGDVPIGTQFGDLVKLLETAVEKIKNPPPAPIQVPHTFRFVLDPAKLNREDIFTLTAGWKLSRTAFVDPDAVKNLPEVGEVTSLFPPDVKSPSAADYSVLTFANTFEKSFPTLKLAVKSASKEASHDAKPLWVIRKSLLKFQFNADRPWYYAPRPISNSLWSGDVDLPDYAGGDSGPQRVTDIDLDVHTRYSLTSLEEVLAPNRAFNFDPQTFTTLMGHKRTLANKLQVLLEPLDTRNPSPYAQKSAQEAFYGRVASNLTQFYATDCILQLPITTTAAQTSGNEPPRIYGKMLGSPVDSSLGKQFCFTFSPAKVPTGATTGQESLLTVLFGATVNPDSPTDPVLPPAPVFDLQFQVTHLEFEIAQRTLLDTTRRPGSS
jgi:hypothetical protein